ncbi:MAG: type II toxin-antitoxin system HicB family antitoxin [Candidatus Altiarchaeota archaeon]|nr:type II toxin-antitoxin system HicB family antitoxin [Candidatus Altiarchaeota archaeon]
MDFDILIEKAEDGYYVATVPGLPGICVSQGKTEEEVLSNIREALELHLEGLKEEGIPIPQKTEAKLKRIAVPA